MTDSKTITKTDENISKATLKLTLQPEMKEIAVVHDTMITSTATATTTLSTISSTNSCDGMIAQHQQLLKQHMTLDLLPHDFIVPESGNGETPGEDDGLNFKSPKSGHLAGNSKTIPHQSSVTSQVEVVDDRKRLRDALHQGIFHRHRRTLFAVGSFLRMLKSRSSKYNTIRSSPEGEEEAR